MSDVTDEPNHNSKPEAVAKSTAATGPAFRGNKSLSVLVQKG
jgi:hypothetical protein